MTVSEFNICVERYADGIFRFVLKMSANQADAKDTVQNTFEKLWNKCESVKFESAKSFLFTTAYRDWIDQTRKIKRMHFTDTLPDRGVTDKAQIHIEKKEILDKAFDGIPTIQKSVILLRDYEGYSYEEIADITGLNLSQVKVYIFRGRKKLQTAIRSFDEEQQINQM